MGLDMTLERYPKNKTREQAEAEESAAFKKDIECYREYRKNVEIAYWRKVNWLHGFIVKTFAAGVDECQDIELKLSDVELTLAKLREAASVLAGKKLIAQRQVGVRDYLPVFVDDQSVSPITIVCEGGKLVNGDEIEKKTERSYWKVEKSAWDELSSILPPTPGFFFGSQSYDVYYVEELFRTIGIFDKVVADWDDDFRVVYSASW